jgi:hypothetical protein
VFGSETWAIIETDMKTLGTLERRILRGGPVLQQGMWRIRNNKELRELYED